MKRYALLITFAATVGFALTTLAGTVEDFDGDGVPDAFDNCVDVPNANQRDEDNDGFGTACDCDFVPAPGDGFVLGSDIADLLMFGSIGTTSSLHDINGDGFILGDDVAYCLSRFNMPPG